jgi:hypothetical protein
MYSPVAGLDDQAQAERQVRFAMAASEPFLSRLTCR